MLQTKLETRSVTILRFGLSKTAFLLSGFLLVFAITALSWGEVHSFGNVPSFAAYPSAIIAGEGNQINFRILSSDKDVQYDILLKGRRIHLGDSSVFNLDIPFNDSFTYLILRGTKNWSTSAATLLIISPQMGKVDVNKPLSLFFHPTALPTNLYVFVNSSFGREGLKVFLNSKKIEDYRLSPIEDSAKMFEIPLKSIPNGICEVRAQLSLITDQILTATATLSYFLDKKPPKILGVNIAPQVIGPKNDIEVSVLATDQSNVKSVSINGIKATLKNGKWTAVLKEPFRDVTKSGYKALNLPITASDDFNNTTATSISTDVFVDVNPPRCQILPLSREHTYSIPKDQKTPLVTLNVKLWTDSSVAPTNVKVLLDGNDVGTTVKIERFGNHTLKVKAVNPINGKSTDCSYNFNVVEAKTIPFWTLVMFFSGTLILLLFTLH